MVPLRLDGSGLTRAIAFDLHQSDQIVSTAAVVCGFVPLRGAAEHAEHLDLWLAATARNFARLSVGAHARTSGLADPALRWAGAALYDGGTFAYLAAGLQRKIIDLRRLLWSEASAGILRGRRAKIVNRTVTCVNVDIR